MTMTETAPIKSKLVLDSLEVKNFRAFRHLQIPRLGRVNLITGKNNVGKSSFLEALLLFARRGSPESLWQILRYRGQAIGNSFNETDKGGLIDGIKDLFHGASMSSINSHAPLSFSIATMPLGYFEIALQWIQREDVSYHLGVEVVIPGRRTLYEISRITDAQNRLYLESDASVQCRLISADGLDKMQISSLWDEIALTPLQDELLTALRLIEKNTLNVNLKGDSGIGLGRTPYVQLVSQNEPKPLRLLGDGMNRLFGMTLGLVNARDGFLLVDEIENGLHYSVLPQVWQLIFATARRLNVQVFATTHSWDCVEAFQIAAEEDKEAEGVLVRLQNKNGNVMATTFDERQLAIVTREQIEVR